MTSRNLFKLQVLYEAVPGHSTRDTGEWVDPVLRTDTFWVAGDPIDATGL